MLNPTLARKPWFGITFNNKYAPRVTIIISDNTLITSIITDLFNQYDSEVVLEFASLFGENPQDTLAKFDVKQELAMELDKTNTRIELITSENLEELINDSSLFRKQIRGESIGGLG